MRQASQKLNNVTKIVAALAEVAERGEFPPNDYM